MSLPVSVYTYTKCSTCRNAVAWLQSKNIPFEEKAIYTNPPSLAELRRMLDLQGGELRRLFNTSGIQYREQNIKEALPKMTTEAALKLLASDGRLVKRPFLLTETAGLLGFKEESWTKVLLEGADA